MTRHTPIPAARSPQGLGDTATIPNAALLWPVYEFRPRGKDLRGTVLRYAEGQWLPDDGEFDLAFVCYGMGAPMALYVRLPYQRNILWSGLTSHWQDNDRDHPGGNPWHYMLREGETDWGGPWGRDRHLNRRAGDAAMSKCCDLMRCANGGGPEFNICDPYIVLGLLRERDTKQVVKIPRQLDCMYCGHAWERKLLVKEAAQ